MQTSDLQALRAYEHKKARSIRGRCTACGHGWQPRNPNPTVNRCPGCGLRGTVKYDTISAEPYSSTELSTNKDGDSGTLVDELQAAARKGSAIAKKRAAAAIKKRPVAIKVRARKKKG